MTIRTAVRQSPIVTAVLVLVGAWTGLQVLHVVNVTESFGTVVGRGGVAGVMGVLVMLAFLGLLVVLWGEFGSVEPGPDRFPPEE